MSVIDTLVSNFLQYPNNKAIYYNCTSITYSELGIMCNSIAHYLSGNDIQGCCIAIEAENATDHVAAMLGIILSGNYYLTVTTENSHHIDSSFPIPIIYSILSLKDKKKLDSKTINHIYLDDIKPYINSVQIHFQGNELTNFCALITSGTSGMPKVVVHTHKTINEDILRQIASNGITADDKLDLIFSMTFSAALSCIFPALVAGAELCVFPLKQHGINELVSFWEDREITYTTMSVSTFNGVCSLYESLQHVASIRCVALGAEPVTTNTIELFKSRFAEGTCLKIAYASTETRTISQIILENNESISAYNFSLGKAVANKAVCVISENGTVLQPNEIGEIVVASAYIAAGYAGNVTEISEPFSLKGDVISYKTGDIGYINSDGNIFYKGRKFDEIKFNGIKIDLNRIELALATIPGIIQVAVVINDAVRGKRNIVAFIKSNEQAIDTGFINTHLKDRLPEGHYPHFYCIVDEFPKTHTDKVDRKKLEAVTFIPLPQNRNEKLPPGDELEHTIIQVFNKVLSTDSVHRDSSFFTDLGGDSLVSLVAITELEKQLAIKLPAFSLWVYPTPLQLANYVHSGLYNKKVHSAYINEQSTHKRNLFCINRFRGGNDYGFIINKLAGHFNLIHLLHESESLENLNDAETLMAALGDAIMSHDNSKGAIVLGLSFQGFLGQQLAAIITSITDCILLDTYNYFEIGGYVQERPKLLKAAFVIKNTVLSGDAQILKGFIKGRLKRPENQTVQASPVRTNRKHMFWHDYYIKAAESGKNRIPNNCLFFRATRDFTTHPTHGYNWKSHVKGDFNVVNVKCTHLEITAEEHSELIAAKILEIIKH